MGINVKAPFELGKLFFVVLYVVLAGLSNWAALAYVHDLSGREALPDIVFSLIDEQPWALKVGDAMAAISGASIILLFVFHKHRVIVAKRVIFIVASLYTMRTFTLISTQLPPGYKDNYLRCRSQYPPDQRSATTFLRRLLEQTKAIGFQNNQEKMLCGDLLFSGHTLMMIVSTLSVGYYLPTMLKPLRYLLGLFSVVGMTCMIISRTHYSIDVLISYFLSAGFFTIYHSYVEIETTKERKNSIIGRLWVTKVIGWLEENVIPGRLENKLEIPFIKRNDKTSHKSFTTTCPESHVSVDIAPTLVTASL
uniref:PAP2_C domain-containing protein n=1 Tax=Rhabditophanes sp. KR3021 TaxID=114890 RepID=A0AC35UAZ6_9BILA